MPSTSGKPVDILVHWMPMYIETTGILLDLKNYNFIYMTNSQVPGLEKVKYKSNHVLLLLLHHKKANFHKPLNSKVVYKQFLTRNSLYLNSSPVMIHQPGKHLSLPFKKQGGRNAATSPGSCCCFCEQSHKGLKLWWNPSI